MGHFSAQDWADFVRGQATTHQQASISKHLDEGCSACQQEARAWKVVADLTRQEKAYTPPANATRIVESYFSPFVLASRQAGPLRLAKLRFNSVLEAATAGVRGSERGPEQFMYQCGDVLLDLRLEAKPVVRSIDLIGQMMDASQSATPLPGVAVSLLRDEGSVMTTISDQLGEFHFSFPSCPYPRLLIGMKDAAWLVVLPALDRGFA